MSTIISALDELAEKVGAGADSANALTIVDKIDAITNAVQPVSNSADIADAVEQFGGVAPTYTASYTLLVSAPDDWATKYWSYFQKDASNNYVPVTKGKVYTVTEEEPDDWETNYGDYYMYSDSEWVNVEKVPEYTLTTEEPADWDTNYTDYYTKDGDVYSAVTGDTAPTWEASTYYSMELVIPTWEASTYYTMSIGVPAFAASTYYKQDAWT